MIDFFSKPHLKGLIEISETPCLSVFMPTHRAGAETLQDPIRLKNLLRRARKSLAAVGLGRTELASFLQPLRDLLKATEFWQHQSDGLAMFRSRSDFACYRLPVIFQELAVVADRFHVKPLLPVLTLDHRFYILALSQKSVRLLEATRYQAAEVSVEGMPDSLRQVTSSRVPGRQLQYHTAGAAAPGGGPPIYHGQGGCAEDSKTDSLKFFRAVGQALRSFLGEEQAPIIVACVNYLFPLYREAHCGGVLLEQHIQGNPETSSAEQLHAQAWSIVEAHFSKVREEAASEYRKLTGTSRVSTDLTTLVRAACHGRVECMFVGVGVQRWGRYDAATSEVTLREKAVAGDEDLLNLAAVQTYLQGGRVFAMNPADVPGQAPAAAILRF